MLFSNTLWYLRVKFPQGTLGSKKNLFESEISKAVQSPIGSILLLPNNDIIKIMIFVLARPQTSALERSTSAGDIGPRWFERINGPHKLGPKNNTS